MKTVFKDWYTKDGTDTRSVSWLVDTEDAHDSRMYAEFYLRGYSDEVCFYVDKLSDLQDFKKLIAVMEEFAKTVESSLADAGA